MKIPDVPKAELHVHLEGTAPPALIRRLAERNRLPVPEGVFRSDDEFEWSDFLHFLRTYDLAASVIRTPEDYRDVSYEYLAGCASPTASSPRPTASRGATSSTSCRPTTWRPASSAPARTTATSRTST